METTTRTRKLPIDYVEFPVRDVQEAKRFYGTLFGWAFEDYGADYVAFDHGSETIQSR